MSGQSKKQRSPKGRSNQKTGPKNRPASKSAPKKHSRSDGPRESKRPYSGKPNRQDVSEGITPKASDGYFLHGRHAVEAALRNSRRDCVRMICTDKFLKSSDIPAIRPKLPVQTASPDKLDASVFADSPHQGVLLEVRPLAQPSLEELAIVEDRKNIVVLLDQVTDPHNVGACLRSAAALGACAVVTMDKNSPQETGTLARSSSGGLEVLPWIRVTNLSQALDTLAEMGFWRIGLDGATDTGLSDLDLGNKIALVMGSEGKGLRPLVRKHCDVIAKIPMTGLVESLNVSNAAAIAIYELNRP